MAQYFYQTSDGEQGPVSSRELVALIATGTLEEHARGREQNTTEWIAADELPGLLRSVEKLRSQVGGTASSADQAVVESTSRTRKRQAPNTENPDSAVEAIPDVQKRSGAIFIVPLLIVALSTLWLFTRPARFPKPSSGDAAGSAVPSAPSPGAELPITEIRAPAVDPPSLNIPLGVAQPVPGLEMETGLSSPTLSDDLKTIVFVKLGVGKDDLFLARRDLADQPFEKPVRLACSTRYTEAFCSLSPNGTQLVFTVQENGPSRLMLATSSDNFSSAKRVLISGVDVRRQHVDNP